MEKSDFAGLSFKKLTEIQKWVDEQLSQPWAADPTLKDDPQFRTLYELWLGLQNIQVDIDVNIPVKVHIKRTLFGEQPKAVWTGPVDAYIYNQIEEHEDIVRVLKTTRTLLERATRLADYFVDKYNITYQQLDTVLYDYEWQRK